MVADVATDVTRTVAFASEDGMRWEPWSEIDTTRLRELGYSAVESGSLIVSDSTWRADSP